MECVSACVCVRVCVCVLARTGARVRACARARSEGRTGPPLLALLAAGPDVGESPCLRRRAARRGGMPRGAKIGREGSASRARPGPARAYSTRCDATLSARPGLRAANQRRPGRGRTGSGMRERAGGGPGSRYPLDRSLRHAPTCNRSRCPSHSPSGHRCTRSESFADSENDCPSRCPSRVAMGLAAPLATRVARRRGAARGAGDAPARPCGAGSDGRAGGSPLPHRPLCRATASILSSLDQCSLRNRHPAPSPLRCPCPSDHGPARPARPPPLDTTPSGPRSP